MLEARTDTDAGATGSEGVAADCGRAAQGKLPVLVIVHQQQSSPGHVGRWLERRGHRLDIRRPRFGDPLPASMDGHAGAVIFGGPMSANDPDDYIRAETDWIGVPLAEGKPFLGICLGAQMLANHLGGKVFFHPESHVEIGYHRLQPTAHASTLCHWPNHVYQWHREGFIAPRDALQLAVADGPFEQQAFVYRGSAVGLQFHPEITYALVSRWSGHHEHRLCQPGAQPRHQHLAGHIVHAPHVHRWMDAFLEHWLAGTVEAAPPERTASSRAPR